MSGADLLAQGITVAGEPVDGCMRYSIGNYGATVEIFTIDGKIVAANSTSTSSGITSASSEQDIRSAYPEATFTSTPNFRSPQNTDLLVSDPNHPDRYLAFSIGADGFNHYEIWSGTKEFVTEPFLMCANAGNSVAAADLVSSFYHELPYLSRSDNFWRLRQHCYRHRGIRTGQPRYRRN